MSVTWVLDNFAPYGKRGEYAVRIIEDCPT